MAGIGIGMGIGIGLRRKTFINENTLGYYTTDTTTVGTDTYLLEQSGTGNDLLIVAGGVVGGKLTPDTVLRMPTAYWDKSNAGTWTTANFFYYDSGNTRDWRVDELHYRLIDEVFGVNPTHRTFGKQKWTDEVFDGLTELVLYSTEQTELRTLRNYIGIKDFQNQGNYYYSGEWTIRNMLQFVVEGTTFDLNLSSASSDTLYWSDGTSDTVTSNANYAHTWTYGGKHLVSVTDDLIRFDINDRGVKGDIAYWAPAMANWVNIEFFYIYSNQFTGNLESWATAMANWVNIAYFRIYSNQFTGNLESWATAMANWVDIVFFRIDDNQFTGNLESWSSALANWVNILYFYIYSNQFTGNLESWASALVNWGNINIFHIYDNQFTGIYAPAQLSLRSALLQDNNGSLESVNTLLEDWYNYYLNNTPVRDVTLNISGGTNAVPTYVYQPLLDLFTDAGYILSITTN